MLFIIKIFFVDRNYSVSSSVTNLDLFVSNYNRHLTVAGNVFDFTVNFYLYAHAGSVGAWLCVSVVDSVSTLSGLTVTKRIGITLDYGAIFGGRSGCKLVFSTANLFSLQGVAEVNWLDYLFRSRTNWITTNL